MFLARGDLTSWCRLSDSSGDNVVNSLCILSPAQVSLKIYDRGRVKHTLGIAVDVLGQTECVSSCSQCMGSCS